MLMDHWNQITAFVLIVTATFPLREAARRYGYGIPSLLYAIYVSVTMLWLAPNIPH